MIGTSAAPNTLRPTALAMGAAVTAGALALGAMASTPTANATCFSIFGLGDSAQCSSSLTSIAIAIGTNAQAHATGILGTAVTLGNTSTAITDGLFNLAVTLGTSTRLSRTAVSRLPLWAAAQKRKRWPVSAVSQAATGGTFLSRSQPRAPPA